ncbi:DUF481 domain-containing protein [Frigidibacter mobilis]|uniref:Salt-stress induced outer membrane protein n=1 Tax=Frigidibacter mobilis TaxID=1335048 RepID=A0A159Z6X6_9RHOB|nr:DUF481 domain-containing protein [Frigidibacter mobilis]AMY70224.1 salt-stress induced outer membrane protein [Frigidibacter mobilis]
MKTILTVASASTLALLIGASAVAAQGTLVGTEALDDRIDDITEDAQDDLDEARDAARFGREEFRPGWSGNVALTYAGTSGNTETQDLALAGRLRYGQGLWNHTIGFGIEYGEDDGEKTKKELFAVYDANYSLTDRFYVFGLARAQFDDYAPFKQDAFLGFGPGYRIINTTQTAWRVQAGPGIRYVKDQLDEDDTEVAFIASSRLFHAFNETVFLTNDTDILSSDAGTLVSNDLGLNFAMTDTLSTRISYRTDYNDEAVEGTKKTDNRLGVSLVMGF